MNILIKEDQLKRIVSELSGKSYGVEPFLDKVKATEGLLKYLGFRKFESLKEYVDTCDLNEFRELEKDAEGFSPNKED